MAKKEQCLKCKDYNLQIGLCTIKWEEPKFDGTICEQIAVAADGDAVDRKPNVNSEEQGTDQPYPKIQTRKGNGKNHRVRIQGSAVVAEENHEVEKTKNVVNIPEKVLHIIGGILFVLIIGGVGYGAYSYIQHEKDKAKEELVWRARIELEAIRSSKIIEYLRLFNIEQDKDLLMLSFVRSEYSANKIITDSVIRQELASLVAIAPDRWDTIYHYLSKAGVDLQATYSNIKNEPSTTIKHEDFAEKLLSANVKEAGLALFSKLKAAEILRYALVHFDRDIIFRADSVSLDDKFVRLNLSYDDTKAQIGKSYTDTTRVNQHFTDPVGEMGSILDGMLSICTRTNRGFGFVYTGRKSHRKDVCEWNVEKTREIAIANSNKLLLDGRKTNQVRTVLYRKRKE